jgi:hypothetical protein
MSGLVPEVARIPLTFDIENTKTKGFPDMLKTAVPEIEQINDTMSTGKLRRLIDKELLKPMVDGLGANSGDNPTDPKILDAFRQAAILLLMSYYLNAHSSKEKLVLIFQITQSQILQTMQSQDAVTKFLGGMTAAKNKLVNLSDLLQILLTNVFDHYSSVQGSDLLDRSFLKKVVLHSAKVTVARVDSVADNGRNNFKSGVLKLTDGLKNVFTTLLKTEHTNTIYEILRSGYEAVPAIADLLGKELDGILNFFKAQSAIESEIWYTYTRRCSSLYRPMCCQNIHIYSNLCINICIRL